MSENKISVDYYEEIGSLLIDFGSCSKGAPIISDAFVIISPSSNNNGIVSIEILLDDKEVAEKIAEMFKEKK